MALFRYLKLTNSHLPDPKGPLSAEIASHAIQQEVFSTEKGNRMPKKRGSYKRLSDDLRAKIGKYACENGNAVAVRRFSMEFDRPLNESTVRSIKKRYYEELKRKWSDSESLEISVVSLPQRKRGRPLHLGETIDSSVQSYIKIRENEHLKATAAAKGITIKTNRTVLQEYGGSVVLSKSWAQSLLCRMGFVKRKGNTKTRVQPANFEDMRASFLKQINTTVEFEEILPQLVINWDQTALSYVPVSEWTMEREGAKRVEIGGLDDKRKITVVFAGTLSGDFLPVQLVYQGTTNRCHAAYPFPDD